MCCANPHELFNERLLILGLSVRCHWVEKTVVLSEFSDDSHNPIEPFA